MKTYLSIIALLALVFLCLSCGKAEKKGKPVYIDVNEPGDEVSYVQTDETTIDDDIVDSDVFNQFENDKPTNAFSPSCNDIIKIPFRYQNGVKFVQVRVNGVAFEMIFDTGCSMALISMAEANYLYQKGKLSPNDIIGFTQLQIADGSIVEDMVVNLSEVVIGDKIVCNDVKATVSSNVNAPLLLGNDVLDRLATITIDNEENTLNFEIKQMIH